MSKKLLTWVKIASLVCVVSLVSACGGGVGPTSGQEAAMQAEAARIRAALVEAIREATADLDAAKGAVSNAYAADSNRFPATANPPFSTVPPPNAKYVKSINYNSGWPEGASVLVTLGGTGETNIDGKYFGVFGTGQADGTVRWMCGTAAAATSVSIAAQTSMYPYLPAPCRH